MMHMAGLAHILRNDEAAELFCINSVRLYNVWIYSQSA